MLVPQSRPRNVVIMDYLPAHKSPVAEAAIKANGACLPFVPPYSPHLNPIETAFSKLKAHLKAISARTIIELEKAIADICRMFAPDECSNCFKVAGVGFT